MERYMYQDDSFERMLKQKADEYRMYPSTQTWDKIQKRVQKKNSFFTIKSVGLTVVLLSAFSLYLSNNQESHSTVSLLSQLKDLNESEAIIQTQPLPVKNKVRFTQSAFSETSVTHRTEMKEAVIPLTDQQNVEMNMSQSVSSQPEIPASEEFMIKKTDNDHALSLAKPELYLTDAPQQKTQIISTEHLSETVMTEESPSLKTDAELNYEVNIPMIIKPKAVKQIQFYITPSISYRVLYADNKVTFGNLPQQDPSNAVIHRAALGFEAGASILFPTSKRIKFRTGLQFNYTHYEVNAFNSAPQLTTIRLNYSSIQRVSTLNNNSGYYAKDIANETFQISIPVGVEVKLAGKKKVQWDMATNLQPSYLVKASGYLLTNDLKNYVKAPDLMSHLNLNASLESFIRWDAGTFSLQAGPQLRYQLFSNARGEYPIREHLVDYGFRIGIVKPLR